MNTQGANCSVFTELGMQLGSWPFAKLDLQNLREGTYTSFPASVTSPRPPFVTVQKRQALVLH